MFASAFPLLAALALQQIVIPIGPTPRQIDRPRAPIAEAGPRYAAACADNDEWDKPAPPVRIHANTYLVGTCGISAILVTGTEGHVLIDGGTEKGAELVAANIRALGFKLADIRFLLHSHEHHDHVGGIVAASAADRRHARRLGAGREGVRRRAPRPATIRRRARFRRIAPARVGRVIGDGDTVRLGNLHAHRDRDPGAHRRARSAGAGKAATAGCAGRWSMPTV